MDRTKWEYRKLREVCFYPNKRISISEISPNQYVGVESLLKDRGGISFGDDLPNTDSAIEYLEGDILIGNIRPYLKKIWKADRYGGASGDVVNVRIQMECKDYISSEYLYKVLSSDKFFEYDNGNTHGAKMPRGDKKTIAEFLFPVPPFPDQQYIIAELDKLNELLVLKRKELADLDNLAQSLFYEMFGDPVLNEKGWDITQLGDICEVTSFKRVLIEDVVDKGIPFIRGTELMALSRCAYGESIDFTLFITPEHYERVKSISGVPKKGDLLIPSINAEGNVWILDTDEPRYYKDGRVLWVHVNENVYSSEALKYIMHILLKNTYSEMASGATFAELKLFVLRELRTILPPLPLQQSFAAKIAKIEAEKQRVKTSLKDLETLLASRMQYWFD